ncbi:MAG: hypothetical protein WKG07_26560 [Hymenobacter sp.]
MFALRGVALQFRQAKAERTGEQLKKAVSGSLAVAMVARSRSVVAESFAGFLGVGRQLPMKRLRNGLMDSIKPAIGELLGGRKLQQARGTR